MSEKSHFSKTSENSSWRRSVFARARTVVIAGIMANVLLLTIALKFPSRSIFRLRSSVTR